MAQPARKPAPAQHPIRRPAQKIDVLPPAQADLPAKPGDRSFRDALNANRTKAGLGPMPTHVVDGVEVEPCAGAHLPSTQLRLVRLVAPDGSYTTIDLRGIAHRRARYDERRLVYHKRGCPHHADVWQQSKLPTCWALEAERDGYRCCSNVDERR